MSRTVRLSWPRGLAFIFQISIFSFFNNIGSVRSGPIKVINLDSLFYFKLNYIILYE